MKGVTRIAAMSLVLLACASPQLADTPRELALHDLNGHAEHPSLARGHPLLLHFGATW